MADALFSAEGEMIDYTPVVAVSAGEMIQLSDGRAAFAPTAIAAGVLGAVQVCGIVTCPKTASIVMLDGGKAYWDASASKVHFKQVNDRDYYAGTVVGDTEAAATTVKINLNVNQRIKVDLARDAFASVLVGTAALNGFGFPYREGGSHRFNITATNEAQKVDALALEGFAYTANPIVEFAFRGAVGSGSASDFSIGVANATHASDADTITDSCFIHLNGNDLNIYAECDDGTNETAATDTTVDYVATAVLSSRVECWIDMRDMSSIKFYVDGIRVLSGTTFSMAASTATLYPIVHVEKTSGTETAAINIDWLTARTMEQ
jgi:predicted RecA/RadA family phage recombinase